MVNPFIPFGLRDLAFRKILVEFAPKLLKIEQNNFVWRFEQDMLENVNSIPDFLNTVITDDDTWVYGCDPETRFQSSQWKAP